MHALAQLLFDLRKFRPYTVASGFPHEQKASSSRFSADVGNPEKIERFRFAEPAPFSICHREAAKLDQAGLVRVVRSTGRA